MINKIIQIILITFLPFLELRASIPYGILKLNMDWILVFLIAIIANFILGVTVYILIDKIIHIATKIKIIEKVYHKYVERTQKKIHKYVEKYGEIGVAIFIGIPLPGSGVYSGVLGSYLIGLDFKKFVIACAIGVLIAGVVVTIITLTGFEIFSFFIKSI